jgi:hypothetical protein
MKIGAAAIFSTLALCGVANANIIPTLSGTSLLAGVTTYSYSLALSAGEDVQTGSEFCFANIAGLTGTGSAPAGWSVSQSTSGGCPGISAGVTSPNAADSVLYTYSGNPIDGATGLGTFTFKSTDGTVRTLSLAYGADTEATNPVGPDHNQGDVNGPSASSPEPTTLGLIGGGLLGLGLFRRKIASSRSTVKAG